jgi:hypothetical protein
MRGPRREERRWMQWGRKGEGLRERERERDSFLLPLQWEAGLI